MVRCSSFCRLSDVICSCLQEGDSRYMPGELLNDIPKDLRKVRIWGDPMSPQDLLVRLPYRPFLRTFRDERGA
jgi:hypothetical protein